MTTHLYGHRPAQHRSRREIGLAIGDLMGICSAHEALEAPVDATRVSGAGPGGVSRALLDIVTSDAEPAAFEAVAHWSASLGLSAHRGN